MPTGRAAEFLLALPHLLVAFWFIWLVCTPAQVNYLLAKKNRAPQLQRTGELMSFREIAAVGCIGGFILLSFITAYCCWLTLSIAGVI